MLPRSIASPVVGVDEPTSTTRSAPGKFGAFWTP
jgi:hypothetical protein